jgi:tetratricopeptide (TPR) repeat protein
VGGNPVLPYLSLAYLEVARNADPAAARRVLDKVAVVSPHDSLINLGRWDLAMLERDYHAAEKALAEVRFEDVSWAVDGPKSYYQGRTALARGDIESARRYLEAATVAFENRVRNDPDEPQNHAALGLVYAYRQMKEEAIRESRRAIELEPESKNAFHGALYAANLALVFALVGESDSAVALLEHLLIVPGPLQGLDYPQNITVGDLRLRSEWDRLRTNPRFQKILASPEPKTVY